MDKILTNDDFEVMIIMMRKSLHNYTLKNIWQIGNVRTSN